MFSGMQELNPLTICQQAREVGDAYKALSTAYVSLAQIRSTWNAEVNEYLHEERYCNATATDFLDAIIEFLEVTTPEMQRLARDHENLCNDLVRVGRGESFSV